MDFARLTGEKRLGEGGNLAKRALARSREPVWTLGQDNSLRAILRQGERRALSPDHLARSQVELAAI